jgi:hypothetical protein
MNADKMVTEEFQGTYNIDVRINVNVRMVSEVNRWREIRKKKQNKIRKENRVTRIEKYKLILSVLNCERGFMEDYPKIVKEQ